MSKVDQITVEVIHNYLLSAAREMNRNLIRTSYNTIIYEIHDFGLGIYDRHCRLLAEAPGLAIFTRGNDFALEKLVEFVGEENMHPGDLILLNYPYWSSAHTLDVMASSPIFHGDRLVGYAVVKQHWLDLGQKDAGYCLDTTEIFQEGLFLPCVKLYNQGVLNKEVENIIRFNSRMPDRVIGDMNAQVSSCRTGERRVQELVEKFGLDTFEEAVEEILDHGERISRARLAELPKGTWSAEDWVDDDGIDTDLLEQHDIAGERPGQLGVAHGMAAVFDDEGLSGIAAHIGQRLGKRLRLGEPDVVGCAFAFHGGGDFIPIGRAEPASRGLRWPVRCGMIHRNLGS